MRTKLDRKQKRLILAAILLLLTFGITALVRVGSDITYPVGRDRVNAGVYATLGDACIFLNVLLVGGPLGALISAVGMAVADLVVGSKLYIMGTLLVKAAMAFCISAFCKKCNSWAKCFAVAGVVEGIMLIGTFIFTLVIVREFSVALKALLYDLAQAIVCAGAGAVILHYVPAVRSARQVSVRRRRSRDEDEDDEELDFEAYEAYDETRRYDDYNA